jgi:hypothetical protein
MNCGLRHFGKDVMQPYYRPAPICANFSFKFLKKELNRREHQSSFRRIHGTTWSYFAIHYVTINSNNWFVNFRVDVHLLRWETVWQNTPRIWRDFGSALPSRICLTQPKPVLQLPNEHGSQVKDQGRRQSCHTKHKTFPYRPTRDVSLLSGHASYNLHWGYNRYPPLQIKRHGTATKSSTNTTQY